MSVVGEAGDGWLKITYGGITGCVSAQYVSTTKPTSSGGNNSTSGGGSGYDYTPPEGLTGTAAENIIAIAASQIGYQEGYNNDTKYGIAFGIEPSAVVSHVRLVVRAPGRHLLLRHSDDGALPVGSELVPQLRDLSCARRRNQFRPDGQCAVVPEAEEEMPAWRAHNEHGTPRLMVHAEGNPYL